MKQKNTMMLIILEITVFITTMMKMVMMNNDGYNVYIPS